MAATGGGSGPGSSQPGGAAADSPGKRWPAQAAELAALLVVPGLVLWGAAYTYASAYFSTFDVALSETGYSQQFAVANVTRWLVAFGPIMAIAAYSAVLGVVAFGAGVGTALFMPIWACLNASARAALAGWLYYRWLVVIAHVLVYRAVILVVVVAALGMAGTFKLHLTGVEDGVAARRLDSMQDITWPYFLGDIHLTTGIGQWQAPSDKAPRQSFVLLLGRSDGQTVFYDYCREGVIRVPTDGFYFLGPQARGLRSTTTTTSVPATGAEAPNGIEQFCQDMDAAWLAVGEEARPTQPGTTVPDGLARSSSPGSLPAPVGDR